MEKPSLEIGNGNWAIKENSLLGHTTVDGMILPDPVTVTRATLATRINPSGLVEDVALLGDEILDGGFDIDGNWTKQTGWSIANGVANSVASGNGQDLIRSVNGEITSGKIYKIEYTISNHVTGGVKTFLSGGGAVQGVTNSGNGTYVDYLLAPANNTSFKITTASGGFTGSIENVSLKEATINGLAKIDYTDGTASLLVEPARTNTVTYSEDFSQYSTGGTAITLTTGQLAPDGTLTATKISGVIGSSSLYRSGESSVTATRSIYARTVSGTGTASLMSYYSNTNNTFTITEEWQRFELTGAVTTGGANFYPLDFRDTSTTLSEVIVWGSQSEEAAYSTSYIKTQGSTVTRAQDVIAKTGISDKINSTEGVLFLEVAAFTTTNPVSFITLNDGGGNNKAAFYYNSVLNTIIFEYVVGGATQASFTYTSSNITNFNKVAFSWKLNQFKLFVNGIQVGSTDTSGSVNSAGTLNKLSFDFGNGAHDFEGKVKQLQVYKTALTDLELESLTSFASFTEMANTLNYTIY